jgi:predicted phosphodiesterase
MKLMFASDIHGSLPATERCFSVCTKRRAVAGYSGRCVKPWPAQCAAGRVCPGAGREAQPFAWRIIAVRGNCDSEVDQMLLHFPIPRRQQVLLEKCRLF